MSRIYGLVMQAIKGGIGSKTDAASASGTVHAKLADLRNVSLDGAATMKATPSDTIRASAPTSRNGQSVTVMRLEKTIMALRSGVIRTKYNFRAQFAGYNATAQVYINGVAVGTSRTTSSTTDVQYTEDIAVKAGDQIQIYAMSSTGGYYVHSFQLCFTDAGLSDSIVLKD